MTLSDASMYGGYLYSYPHKTAYRTLDPAVPLGELWSGEDVRALSLYLHVPFCEMRCGFCNLFTASRPRPEQVSGWLSALVRQARVVGECVGPISVDRWAIGGGTPTVLDADQLETVLGLLEQFSGPGKASSVETSPSTATPDRLAVLARFGVTRISMGVQSFVADEVKSAQRPQSNLSVQRAIEAVRALSFPTLNLDLIYGIPGQTPLSWEHSLRAALAWSPEELYLYPLYVRPLTGMALRAKSADDVERAALYTLGRDLLLAEGYTQVSMRMFQRGAVKPGAYRCQEDGMIGLGVGARSYTRRLHYAWPYAVSAQATTQIIADWAALPDAEFALARHGLWLDDDEQARRALILTLLAGEHVATPPSACLSVWRELEALGWVHGGRLTATGVARADTIGPALISPAVRRRMSAFELR